MLQPIKHREQIPIPEEATKKIFANDFFSAHSPTVRRKNTVKNRVPNDNEYQIPELSLRRQNLQFRAFLIDTGKKKCNTKGSRHRSLKTNITPILKIKEIIDTQVEVTKDNQKNTLKTWRKSSLMASHYFQEHENQRTKRLKMFSLNTLQI